MKPDTSALIWRLRQAQRCSVELCHVGRELVEQAQALRGAVERERAVSGVRSRTTGEGRTGDPSEQPGPGR